MVLYRLWLILFAFTYLCEKGFSSQTLIKTKYRFDVCNDQWRTQDFFRGGIRVDSGARAPKNQGRLEQLMPDDSTVDLVVSKALIPQP